MVGEDPVAGAASLVNLPKKGNKARFDSQQSNFFVCCDQSEEEGHSTVSCQPVNLRSDAPS